MTVEPPLPRLGVDREVIQIDRLEDLQRFTVALARQACRTIDLVSHDLEPRLYDNAEFLTAVRELATGRRGAQIRILARELDTATKIDHRLFELARRLTSFIEIRCLGREDQEFNQAFMIVDRMGMILRTTADRFEAEASFRDPRRAGEQTQSFDALWTRSVSDPSARRLYL
jgi:hypothetical protein